MTTKTAARFARAEGATTAVLFLLVAAAVAYVFTQFSHLDPSLMIGWAVVFAAVTGAKIAFGTKARR